ncbi:hypothetical protein Leryth_013308 [Lithospermum erythrorhizon]|nr:hypothetical protein Leryth_013308 [Lithospermum erythrorhizon]
MEGGQNGMVDQEPHDVDHTTQSSGFDNSHPLSGDGASPGKIFVGGLARETTNAQFVKHFDQYGEITDSVIMKDRNTGQPRGFGFVTYADPSVVDKVIEETHIINGKQVEIKRTTPRGAHGSKDFKTKKIFVGGIPTSVTEDEFKDFFMKFGEVKEQQIMRDHASGRSRGFGFVTFEHEQAVDDLLANGNRLDFSGTQVEIKKAEPKKPNLAPPQFKRQGNSRAGFGGGVRDSYGGGYGTGGPYRAGGAYGGRPSNYGGYGGSSFGSYEGYRESSYGGGYRGEQPSMGYSGRYGAGMVRGGAGMGGGFGRGYDFGGEYGGPSEAYGAFGGGASGYGAGYSSGMGSVGYGGNGPPFYGGSSRGGYGGAGAGSGGRYHPYGR